MCKVDLLAAPHTALFGAYRLSRLYKLPYQVSLALAGGEHRNTYQGIVLGVSKSHQDPLLHSSFIEYIILEYSLRL